MRVDVDSKKKSIGHGRLCFTKVKKKHSVMGSCVLREGLLSSESTCCILESTSESTCCILASQHAAY
jgi:hypothetical protein